jgi:hypothetical protein
VERGEATKAATETDTAVDNNDMKAEKKKKRQRLIVNPEFVQGMDKGDGSQQFDVVEGEENEEEETE